MKTWRVLFIPFFIGVILLLTSIVIIYIVDNSWKVVGMITFYLSAIVSIAYGKTIIEHYFQLRRETKDSMAFIYVFINENGLPRNLTKNEREYLVEVFEGTDGERPYIKQEYTSSTPDGKISGFMLRELVPIDKQEKT